MRPTLCLFVEAVFARDPGARILVNDSHGDMQNLLHTFVDEFSRLVETETVGTKEATTPRSARLRHPDRVTADLRETTARGLAALDRTSPPAHGTRLSLPPDPAPGRLEVRTVVVGVLQQLEEGLVVPVRRPPVPCGLGGPGGAEGGPRPVPLLYQGGFVLPKGVGGSVQLHEEVSQELPGREEGSRGHRVLPHRALQVGPLPGQA
jgi:hypothetical protein